MRRKEREISQASALKLLEKGEYGIVSSVDASGQPYGVPVNYVMNRGCIDFHSATDGHKIENFKHNDRVSFCVVGKTNVLASQLTTNYESVIAFGRIIERRGSEKSTSLEALTKKYAPEHMETGLKAIKKSGPNTRVFSIQIEKMTGKARV